MTTTTFTPETMTAGETYIAEFGKDPENGYADNSSTYELVTFVGFVDGDTQHATVHAQSAGYDFQVYLYQGHWAYGSSADPIAFSK